MTWYWITYTVYRQSIHVYIMWWYGTGLLIQPADCVSNRLPMDILTLIADQWKCFHLGLLVMNVNMH